MNEIICLQESKTAECCSKFNLFSQLISFFVFSFDLLFPRRCYRLFSSCFFVPSSFRACFHTSYWYERAVNDSKWPFVKTQGLWADGMRNNNPIGESTTLRLLLFLTLLCSFFYHILLITVVPTCVGLEKFFFLLASRAVRFRFV